MAALQRIRPSGHGRAGEVLARGARRLSGRLGRVLRGASGEWRRPGSEAVLADSRPTPVFAKGEPLPPKSVALTHPDGTKSSGHSPGLPHSSGAAASDERAEVIEPRGREPRSPAFVRARSGDGELAECSTQGRHRRRRTLSASLGFRQKGYETDGRTVKRSCHVEDAVMSASIRGRRLGRGRCRGSGEA